MVFSTPIFVFVFLPVVVFLIWTLKPKFHNAILLISSIFFYAWGSIPHTFILIFSIILNYFFGILIYNKTGIAAKLILALAIIFNLLLLGYFKYFNFVIDNINKVLLDLNYSSIKYQSVVLPIGISFFTFQAISYIIDVYRKSVPVQKNLFNLALYISLFPKLIAGPIVRYSDISEQLNSRYLSLSKSAEGIQRFIFGFAKKVIVANSMAAIADKIFALPISEISTGTAWLGIIAYTFQIYFDFSGYSDMAIGLGKIFGFDIPENFNFPYVAKSIKEFWRRWHISLSSWFKDYLYIPLGGNRGGSLRTLMNLLIVFFCTGFWHGASWNFIFWGMFHGIFLLIERIGFGKVLDKLWNPVRSIYAILVVIVGWVFFRIESINEAFQYLSVMFPLKDNVPTKFFAVEFYDKKQLIIFSFALLYSLRFFRGMNEKMKRKFVLYYKTENFDLMYNTSKFVLSFILFFMSILYLSGSTYNPFIYFRF